MGVGRQGQVGNRYLVETDVTVERQGTEGVGIVTSERFPKQVAGPDRRQDRQDREAIRYGRKVKFTDREETGESLTRPKNG